MIFSISNGVWEIKHIDDNGVTFTAPLHYNIQYAFMPHT